MKWEIVLQVAVSYYADLQMTQLITRLSWNDPWSTPHHLAAKCVPPYLLLSSCCFYKQQLTFMHGTTHFILRLLNEDKHGASIVYRKWEPLTSTLEEDYDRKCTGHRSHISLLATLTHSLHDYSQTLFCLKRAELLFLLQLFSFWMGEGLFHVMMLMEFCVVWSVAFWMTDDY